MEANRTMKKSRETNKLPSIKVTTEDYTRLSGIASAAMNRAPDVASYLADELDRARIVAPGYQGVAFVKMGCRVEFRDETTGRTQTVTLVYPGEADIEQGKISVLTPIGAALIGLSKDQSIAWTTRSGEVKRLSVLDIREPALA